jgi:hypothetical protein
MIVYFREQNGDFLAVEWGTRGYYLGTFGRDEYQGRATAIAGLLSSVCTTGISRAFLREKCKRVARAAVPVQWLKAIRLEGDEEGS